MKIIVQDIQLKDIFDETLSFFTQWDINQKIIIKGLSGIFTPLFYFCNEKSEESLVVQSERNNGVLEVKVPNVILQEPFFVKIYTHIYSTDEDGKTLSAWRIPVIARPKPSEYQYIENISPLTAIEVENRILQSFNYNFDAKVDKVDGKALSANDYTDIEKAKVASAVPNTRKINGKPLSEDITLSASDFGMDVGGTALAVQENLDTHINNKENPHDVTAIQIGADPLGSAATVQESLGVHINNKNNPHGVTATQIGADSAGSASAVQTNLNTHINNKNNPHGLTAAQLGITAAQIGAAAATHYHDAGNITSGVLTPARGGTGMSPPSSGSYIRSTGSAYTGYTAAQVLSDIGAQPTSQKGASNGYAGLNSSGFVSSPAIYAAPIAASYGLSSNFTVSGGNASTTLYFSSTRFTHFPTGFSIYHWSDGDFAVRGPAGFNYFDVWISASILCVPSGTTGNKDVFVRKGTTKTFVAEHNVTATSNRQMITIPEVYIGQVQANSGYFGINIQNWYNNDIVAMGSVTGAYGATWVNIKAYPHYG